MKITRNYEKENKNNTGHSFNKVMRQITVEEFGESPVEYKQKLAYKHSITVANIKHKRGSCDADDYDEMENEAGNIQHGLGDPDSFKITSIAMGLPEECDLDEN